MQGEQQPILPQSLLLFSVDSSSNISKDAIELTKAIDIAVDHLKSQLDRYVDKYKHPAAATPPIREIVSAEA